MNKQYYSFGNPFKVRFRKHFCYKCGTRLDVVKHRKVVNPKDEEAIFYDFDFGVDGGVMVGSCEFIHKVFHCPICSEQIEFVTQLSFEDVEILINKVKQKFSKKGIELEIKKTFEDKKGIALDKIEHLEDIQCLRLSVYHGGKEIFNDRFPMFRKDYWERPYYFKIYAKEFILAIKKMFCLIKNLKLSNFVIFMMIQSTIMFEQSKKL